MHHPQQMVDQCCDTASSMCRRLGMNRHDIKRVVQFIEALPCEMSSLQEFLHDLSTRKTPQEVIDLIS
jgi:hypothetical protein